MFLFEGKTDTIYIFDVDDTLLYSNSKIGVKEPGENKFKYYSTKDFAKIREKISNDSEYDFSDFIHYNNIYVSIVNGKPNLKVLKILDYAINNGYKIGIITARGNQDAVFDALNNYLLYRDKNGKLKELPKNQFNKKYVFAINDKNTLNFINKKNKTKDTSLLKAFILKYIFKELYGFKKIYFYDDDALNIKAVKDLNDDTIEAIKV